MMSLGGLGMGGNNGAGGGANSSGRPSSPLSNLGGLAGALPGMNSGLGMGMGMGMDPMMMGPDSGEEVSTLFVIGFPEDYTEREFQNMFTFANGYESAALKRQDRKQLIGFVKFETRQQAEEARDFLIGRKVDVDSGASLKAEIAKKNLHTKRGLQDSMKQRRRSNVHQFPPSNVGYRRDSVPSLSGADWRYSPESISPGGFPSSNASDNGYDAFHMQTLALDRIAAEQQQHQHHHGQMYMSEPRGSATLESYYPQSMSSARMLAMRRNSAVTASEYLDNNVLDYVHLQQRARSVQYGPSGSAAEEGFERGDDNFMSLAIAHQSGNGGGGGVSNSNSSGNLYSYGGNGSNGAIAAPIVDRHPFNASGLGSLSSVPNVGAGGLGLGNNRDMMGPPNGENAPCNTLYVGNLPPNASEEELRRMFINCLGYRRLSFQNKPAGPMCFVEFDDISYATQAMLDLHGSILSSSTRGGIRLSYAKNSLGMRNSTVDIISGRRGSQ